MTFKHYNPKAWFVLPMRCLLFIAAFSLCSSTARKNLSEITHWWTILASIVNIVTIVILWLLCKSSGATYRQMLHCEKRQESIFQRLLFILLMLLAGMGGMYLAGWLCYGAFPYLAPMMIAPISPSLAVLNIFILPLTTTLAEEGAYLGYGVNSFPSKWTAVLIPAFFYALQHSFIPMLFDIRFILYRFLSFLPLTIWICFQYYKGRSVSTIMAGHWVLNMATAVQIAVTSFYPELYTALQNP